MEFFFFFPFFFLSNTETDCLASSNGKSIMEWLWICDYRLLVSWLSRGFGTSFNKRISAEA